MWQSIKANLITKERVDLLKNSGGKSLLVYLLISGLIIFGLIYALGSLTGGNDDIKYSTIMEYFDDLKVSEYELDLGSGELTYKLKGEDKEEKYTVPNVSIFVNEVIGAEGENYRVKYNEANPSDRLDYNLIKVKDNSFLMNLLPTLILLGVMIFFFVYMMKSAGGGGKMSSFGKANVKQHLNQGKKSTFDDVAGAEEEKEELAEIVDFLKNPKK
ncbi:MAG: hypothetical protein GX905_09225, partial [Bacteroidales bacterium]|nr:hypothetical protein [Bacteroidales bacterium]